MTAPILCLANLDGRDEGDAEKFTRAAPPRCCTRLRDSTRDRTIQRKKLQGRKSVDKSREFPDHWRRCCGRVCGDMRTLLAVSVALLVVTWCSHELLKAKDLGSVVDVLLTR